MTFHDFFHDLFKLSKTLGLAVSFKNTKPLLVLEHFLTLNSSTDKLWHSPVAPKRTWAWYGDPSFLFKILSFYNINNQWAKFDKTLSAGSNFSGMTLR